MNTSPFAFTAALALMFTGTHRDSVQELEPALYGVHGSPDPYDVAVRQALLEEVWRPKCQVLVKPSFKSEWCVFLRRDDGALPELVCKAMKRQLYGEIMDVLSANGTATEYSSGSDDEARALAQVHIEVETWVVCIDSEVADVLEQVWWRMLGRVQYPENPTLGFDGTHYDFAHSIRGAFRCGEIWSPGEGTRSAALVGIGMRMRELATAPPKSRPEIERVLVQQAKALLKRIDEAAESGMPR